MFLRKDKRKKSSMVLTVLLALVVTLCYVPTHSFAADATNPSGPSKVIVDSQNTSGDFYYVQYGEDARTFQYKITATIPTENNVTLYRVEDRLDSRPEFVRTDSVTVDGVSQDIQAKTPDYGSGSGIYVWEFPETIVSDNKGKKVEIAFTVKWKGNDAEKNFGTANNQAGVSFPMEDGVKTFSSPLVVVSFPNASIPVEKKWADGADRHSTDSVQVDLFQRVKGSTEPGKVIATIFLNAANKWTDMFKNLPLKDAWGGNEWEYYVEENLGGSTITDTGETYFPYVSGPTSTPSTPGRTSGNWEINNQVVQIDKEVNGKTEYELETPGEAVTYTIKSKMLEGATSFVITDLLEPVLEYKGGSANVTIGGQDVTSQAQVTTSGNTLTWDLSSLIAGNGGKDIEITFDAAIKQGADLSSYIVDGKPTIPNKAQIKIDNVSKESNEVKIIPQEKNLQITKVWDDEDNESGRRPDSIKINLLKDGEQVDTLTLRAEDRWKGSFTIPDEGNGSATYTVEEEVIDYYYDMPAEGNAEDGFTFTNINREWFTAGVHDADGFGEFSLAKTVSGIADEDKEYTFRVNIAYDGEDEDYNKTVKIRPGDDPLVYDWVPAGATVTITEIDADGYDVTYKMGDKTVTGTTATFKVKDEESTEVVCDNNQPGVKAVSAKKTVARKVKTGDPMHETMWIGLMMAALAVIILAGARHHRNTQK